jgi:hypothetical protein
VEMRSDSVWECSLPSWSIVYIPSILECIFYEYFTCGYRCSYAETCYRSSEEGIRVVPWVLIAWIWSR